MTQELKGCKLNGSAYEYIDSEDESVIEGHIVGVPVSVSENAAENAVMVNYDQEDGVDEANAMQSAVAAVKHIKWDQNDLPFFFKQVEIKMKSNGVKKNFTKLEVLTTILPPRVTDEIKPILRKEENEFPNKDAYHQAKKLVMRVFTPPKSSAFERAMGRVLSGLPSQLARAIMNDLCDHQLQGCCCHKWVLGVWLRQMPSAVKQAVAHHDFNSDTYQEVLQLADSVYSSTRPNATVAAIATPAPQVAAVGSDETFHQGWLDATPEQLESFPPEVAAIYKVMKSFQGRGRGRGGRGSGRGGRGGPRGGARGGAAAGGGSSSGGGSNSQWSASNPRWTNPRSSDLPPFGSCKKHWIFGKSAHWCQEPTICPWKNFVTKPEEKK